MKKLAVFNVHLTDELKEAKADNWDIVLDALSLVVECYPVTRSVSPALISGFVSDVIDDIENHLTYTPDEVKDIERNVSSVLSLPENYGWQNFIQHTQDRTRHAEILGSNKNLMTYTLELENDTISS